MPAGPWKGSGHHKGLEGLLNVTRYISTLYLPALIFATSTDIILLFIYLLKYVQQPCVLYPYSQDFTFISANFHSVSLLSQVLEMCFVSQSRCLVPFFRSMLQMPLRVAQMFRWYSDGHFLYFFVVPFIPMKLIYTVKYN